MREGDLLARGQLLQQVPGIEGGFMLCGAFVEQRDPENVFDGSSAEDLKLLVEIALDRTLRPGAPEFFDQWFLLPAEIQHLSDVAEPLHFKIAQAPAADATQCARNLRDGYGHVILRDDFTREGPPRLVTGRTFVVIPKNAEVSWKPLGNR